MGILARLRKGLRTIALPALELNWPLHENVQTFEELEDSIQLHYSQLADPKLMANPKNRAFATVFLAVCYYRKACFYSHCAKEDIDRAIQFGHLAEPFFTRDRYPRAWGMLQELLGLSYYLKADGP